MTSPAASSFILASASPRRKQLLEKAGFSFEVIPSKIDESKFSPEAVTPVEFALQLAFAKAIDIAIMYPDRFVLGADTVVDLKGRIIGKPKDAKEAEDITRMLFSQPHKVITAVALIKAAEKFEIAKADTTIVYPKKLITQQIAEHIKSGNWQGKRSEEHTSELQSR